MTIERIGNEIVIKLPDSIDMEGVQRLVNFLLYKEATKHSLAKQEEVDALAKQVNKEWWANHQKQFLPE